MSENEIQSPAATGFNRRSVVKGAAWSVPVIAAAIAAPAASASTRSTDLAVQFSGTRLIGVDLPAIKANVTLANTLTVTNLGGVTSTGGEVLTLTYPRTLGRTLAVASDNALVDVRLGNTSSTIILPALAPGESLVFNLGLIAVPVGLEGGDHTIVASLTAADTNTSNNTATTTVGVIISLL